MPETKRQFTGGKMEKDVDERLVPNGQYRDAMNIEISTTDESDIGTAQNIMGNDLIHMNRQSIIAPGSICVGSISDEKNDAVYWFTTQDSFNSLAESNNTDLYIVESGHYQGQVNWPSYFVGIAGDPQKIFHSEFLTEEMQYIDIQASPNF